MKHSLLFGYLLTSLLFSACKSGNSNSSAVSEAVSSDRSNELHAAIVRDLDAQFQKSKETAWFETTAEFSKDWLIESPEGYWGRDPADLPKNLTCTAGETGCDSTFLRHVCSQDSDCSPYNTTCQVFYPSMTAPGQTPKSMCLGSGDQLMNRFYQAITSANTHVDITTLSVPTERFYEMLVNALAYLSHKSPIPTIRILTAGKESRQLNILNPPGPVIKDVVARITSKGGKVDNLQLDWGYLAIKNIKFSWNHSKIIIVDGDRVISGGHNFYDKDYTSDAPIFDLSMEYRGPAADKVRNFVDELWNHTGDYWDDNPDCSSYIKWATSQVSAACKAVRDFNGSTLDINKSVSFGKIIVPAMKSKTKGSVSMIGVGRLGEIKNKNLTDLDENGKEKAINPSDASFISLIKNARSSVYIAQEDIFSKIPIKIVGKIQTAFEMGESVALPALVDAIVSKNITLRIVQTDQVDPENPDGYGMMSPTEAKSKILAKAVAKAKELKVQPPAGQTLVQYYCQKIEVAPWRFKDGAEFWADGKTRIGSHPKLIIADEAAFYLGSHNFYPANLQEFGVIVTNSAVTKDLLNRYWNKLWEASSPSKISCDKPDSELLGG